MTPHSFTLVVWSVSWASTASKPRPFARSTAWREKTKVEQHLAIVDHFFETPNLKFEKSQKAQSDNDDKFNTLLERAQKKMEAQIT